MVIEELNSRVGRVGRVGRVSTVSRPVGLVEF
jgi:hypothetical protein